MAKREKVIDKGKMGERRGNKDQRQETRIEGQKT
jgi:hypothetical protein